MNVPFFSPDPIWAQELLLVGYQLFPCSRIPIHPRLTILSGNNGVGKTTLLDAIQTIILCHQQYISMNVASGQNDRSIIGQLRQRVAWAVLGIGGHETVTALGVRLFIRPSGEQLDLAPFVLRRLPMTERLFLDPASNEVTPDLAALGRNVLRADSGAECLPFERVDDYHAFLFEQGILPIPLMRKGKKKTFANLWRQITQPRLSELQAFLQEMLCPPPSKRTNFTDVEKLMQDRRGVEDRLRSLVRFRQTRLALQTLRTTLDTARRASLCCELAVSSERTLNLGKQQERMRIELENAQRQLHTQETLRIELEREQTEVLAQRDLCQKQQSSLTVQLRRHKEYQVALGKLRQSVDGLQVSERELAAVDEQCRTIVEQTETCSGKRTELLVEKERLSTQEEQLARDAAVWTTFQTELAKAVEILGRPIRTKADVLELWVKWEEPYKEQQLLGEWRKQLPELRRRREEHLAALELWQTLVRDRQLPDVPCRKSAEELQGRIRREIRDNTLRQETMRQQQNRLLELRETLAKGRPPLPEAARKMVEQGLAEPLAQDFDHLDVHEAALWQKRLGPFALAIRPKAEADLKSLDGGSERVFVVSERIDPREWSGPVEGLGGCGRLGWYEPDGPVWLSGRARAQQLSLLETDLHAVDTSLTRLHTDMNALECCEQICARILAAWRAVEDLAAVSQEEELNRRINRVATNQAHTKTCFEYLNKLRQQLQCFDLEDSPLQLRLIRERLAETASALQQIEAEHLRLQGLRKALEERRKELATMRHTFDMQREQAETVRGTLEREEPLDVLEGRVDFSQAEAMASRITILDRALQDVQRRIGQCHQTIGLNQSEIRRLTGLDADVRGKIERAAAELDLAQAAWQKHYADEEPRILPQDRDESRRIAVRREWDEARGELLKTLEHVCQEYGQEMHFSKSLEPDFLVDDVLRMLIPPDLELDREEDRLASLRDELAKIEKKLRGYVEEIRRNVDLDLQSLSRRLLRINAILANLGFGKVRKVTLKSVTEPVYEGLKHLRGSGQLPLFATGTTVGLREFLDQIREIIARHSRGMQLEDDQITDYRTYVRLTWAIEDDRGQERRSGFSSGEGLGINLAICLSLLFYEGSESGRQRSSGFLLMALDEAERLDERAMNTVRELLDRVECQLMLALPRMLDIPDTLTHILTPLPQGVTHVGVYHAPRTIDGDPVS